MLDLYHDWIIVKKKKSIIHINGKKCLLVECDERFKSHWRAHHLSHAITQSCYRIQELINLHSFIVIILCNAYCGLLPLIYELKILGRTSMRFSLGWVFFIYILSIRCVCFMSMRFGSIFSFMELKQSCISYRLT